ncbi:MAG: adenosylmethionine decarboxylase [Vampirovibrionales bacterium]
MTQIPPVIEAATMGQPVMSPLPHPFLKNLPVTTMLGRHLLAEFYDCDPNILNNADLIEGGMCDAAIKSGATIVEKVFHHFSPWGVSGVVVIAESHLAIHTWPEYGYAAVDLFTCGDTVDPLLAYDHLKATFGAKTAFYSELKRGLLHQDDGKLMKAPFAIGDEHRDDAAAAAVMQSPVTKAQAERLEELI